LSYQDIDGIKLKLQELTGRLKPFLKHREQNMATFKSQNIITPEVAANYGDSDHVRSLINILNTAYAKGKVLKKHAIDIRNFLMLLVSFGNAARASNIINITLEDFDNAQEEPEYHAMSIRSVNYKTSLLYGEKMLLFGKDLFFHIETYVKFCRPLLIRDEDKLQNERYLFTSSRPNNSNGRITHSALANSLTSTFQSANVLNSR